ncbi:MAG: NAD(P)/FAD-dependent oxidoreductase [Polyangiaceae bacterium]|nr:NAD(P)/FAD-dependent oxidoreductase [Polyangiaceae bacterium]
MVSSLKTRAFDVIVIGSGIGGMFAAVTAATAGKRVLLLEAGKQHGGYTNPFRRGKYAFDPGLHYVGECGPGQQLTRQIERLGLAETLRFRELDPDGFDRLVFPGYEVKTPKGAEVYRDRLARDFPAERAGLDAFFALLAEFRQAVAALARLKGVRSLLDVAPHVPLLVRYARATYAELLAPLIKDPLLRAVLAGQGGDYGLSPGRASAMIGLGVLDHYLGGAYFPLGGSKALRDGLITALEQRGGEHRRSARVDRIIVDRGRAIGVECCGVELSARAVISNVDATVTYGQLLREPDAPRASRRKAARTRQSLASICLFIGTDLDVAAAGMTEANIWHYPSVDLDGFYDVMARGSLPASDFFFLSSPSLKDPDNPTKAPPGHHTLELVTLAPFDPFAGWEGMKSMKRGAAYEELKARLADRYLGCVERYVPGIRDHVKALEVATPVTNVTYAASPRGAIYGPEYTPDQMGPLRFGAKGDVKGLFLCGSSTMGAGIVPCAVSGGQAGRLAVASLR